MTSSSACADRPWPHAVLNQIAYTDLIPVIDGGIAIDAFADGGIRNDTWRRYVVAPGRPCLVCNHQIDPGQVSLDISGLLDDPTNIAGTADNPAGAETAGANVSLLSVGAAASQPAQYVSLNTAPGGPGDPGPLQFLLSTYALEHLGCTPTTNSPVETQTGAGDQRIDTTGDDPHAERQRAAYNARTHWWRYRALRYAKDLSPHSYLSPDAPWLRSISTLAERRLDPQVNAPTPVRQGAVSASSPVPWCGA